MIEGPLLSELGAGAAVSAVGGATVWAVGRHHRREVLVGFGRQTVAWAAINGALAVGGLAAARRRERGVAAGRDQSVGTEPSDTDPVDTEPSGGETTGRARTLRRVLLVNAGLDVGYVLGGAVLAGTERRRGDGLAIIVQGAFLFWLDSRHARRLGTVVG